MLLVGKVRRRSAGASPAGRPGRKSAVRSSSASMAGATARRSSMASALLTARSSRSFLQLLLGSSPTAAWPGAHPASSLRPLGVVSRGKVDGRHGVPGLLPAVPRLCQSPASPRPAASELLPVAPGQGLVPRQVRPGQRSRLRPSRPASAPHATEQLPAIGGVVQAVPGPAAQRSCWLLQPALRVGVALELAVQVQHQLLPGGCRPGRRPGCPPAAAPALAPDYRRSPPAPGPAPGWRSSWASSSSSTRKSGVRARRSPSRARAGGCSPAAGRCRRRPRS